jgi:hypothetical protein
MLKMTRRIGRFSGLIAAGVAIVGTGSGVMAASYSAFTAVTPSGSNNWATGNVHLSNDSGSVMFNALNQQQGANGKKCITVTSDGSLSSNVKLYATAFADTNSLGQHISLQILIGSGSSDPVLCTGFSGTSIYNGTLQAFANQTSGDRNYATGVGTWNPQASATTAETKQYQFIWSYDGTTPMSSSASATFQWETQGS